MGLGIGWGARMRGAIGIGATDRLGMGIGARAICICEKLAGTGERMMGGMGTGDLGKPRMASRSRAEGNVPMGDVRHGGMSPVIAAMSRWTDCGTTLRGSCT